MLDRRQEPRLERVFDAQWKGQLGPAACRITDLSWHGCFVDVATPPAVGSNAYITVTLSGTPVQLHGKVRHVWPRIGFGLQIDSQWPLTEMERKAMRGLLNQ